MTRLISAIAALVVAIMWIGSACADYIVIIADLAVKKGSGSGSGSSGSLTNFSPGGGGGGMGMGGMGMGRGGMGMGGMGMGGMGMGGKGGGGMGLGGTGGAGMGMGMGRGGGGMGMGMPGGGGMGMGRGGMGMPGGGGMGMGMPGGGGMGMGRGGMGMPGGGGMGMGMPGGGGMGMGMPGGGGMGMGMPGGGGMGMGRMGGGMGMGMMLGGMSNGNLPGGMFQGGGKFGGGGPPGSGSGSGSSPWFQQGDPNSGNNPFGGRRGELPGSIEVFVPTPLRVVAVVEIEGNPKKEKISIDGQTTEDVSYVIHGLAAEGKGASRLYQGELVEWMPLDSDHPYPTVKKIFDDRRKQLNSARTPENILNLAEWALQHRMLKEFAGLMDELGKVKSDDPSYLAYVKVRDALKAPTQGGREEARWKESLNYNLADPLPNSHYALLHDLGSSTQREVKARKDVLEDTFQIFFYYFAIKGVSDIDVPKERLVSVLEADRKIFKKLWTELEPMPLTTDGFYSRDLNLLVFSKDSQDELRRGLADATYKIAGKNEDALLRGPKLDTKEPESQTLALMLRALERDSELSSTSNGVTRQLLQATGLLPRGLTAPEWVQSGLASFFEVPRLSPYPLCASAHSMYLQPFQMWTANSFLIDPATELKNVITDRTFRQAESARSDSGYFKARAMAWALCYYLAQNYPNELRDYFKELSGLPRELELDETTMLRAFARAFKLMDSKKPNEISDTAVAAFAKNWITAMKGVKLEAEDMVNLVRKYESDATLGPVKGSGSGSGSK